MTFRYARGLLAINSVALLITFLALVVQVAVAGTMSQRVKKLRRSDLTIVWGNSVRVKMEPLSPDVTNNPHSRFI